MKRLIHFAVAAILTLGSWGIPTPTVSAGRIQGPVWTMATARPALDFLPSVLYRRDAR